MIHTLKNNPITPKCDRVYQKQKNRLFTPNTIRDGRVLLCMYTLVSGTTACSERKKRVPLPRISENVLQKCSQTLRTSVLSQAHSSFGCYI